MRHPAGRGAAAAAVGFTVLLASAGHTAPLAEGIRIDQMQPASPQSPFFRAEGPHEERSEGVEYALGVTFDYGKGVLEASQVDTEGNETPLPTPIQHALLTHVGGSLTPAHWLELDFSLPVALLASGEVAEGSQLKVVPGETLDAPSAPGFGDLRVGLHFRPLDARSFGVLFGGRFWASFGSEDAYLSDKRFRAEVDLGFAGDLSSVLYGCTFSVSPGLFLERNGDRGSAACAAHVRVIDALSIGVEPTVSVFRRLDRADVGSFEMMIEPMGALRLRTGGLSVGLGAGPGFGGAPGTAELRGLLSVAYIGGGTSESASPEKRVLDGDLDKIPDDVDACPHEAGPESHVASKRGCPSLDRDADGVRDDEDWCPDRAGVKNRDPKANGCPDSDNDTLPDPIDACPNEPGTGEGGCPRYARLKADTFRVDPPVTFSDADLTPGSRLALEEIAATIRANPKVELLSVALGTKGSKPEVADKRAANVILVFRAGNLDSNRYEVVLREDLPAGTVIIRVVR